MHRLIHGGFSNCHVNFRGCLVPFLPCCFLSVLPEFLGYLGKILPLNCCESPFFPKTWSKKKNSQISTWNMSKCLGNSPFLTTLLGLYITKWHYDLSRTMVQRNHPHLGCWDLIFHRIVRGKSDKLKPLDPSSPLTAPQRENPACLLYHIIST